MRGCLLPCSAHRRPSGSVRTCGHAPSDKLPLLQTLDTQQSHQANAQPSCCADVVTALFRALQACVHSGSLSYAKHTHGHIRRHGLEQHTYLIDCLIRAYDKSGSPQDAWRTFNALQQKSQVSWNMMIGCCVRHGVEKAFGIFENMQKQGFEPTQVTFHHMLNACTKLLSLKGGKLVHACILMSQLESEITLAGAIVTMYGKCGSVEDARSVFTAVKSGNIVLWTTMISAYVQRSLTKEALHVFSKMIQAGLNPNRVTFITILSCCSDPSMLVTGRLIHTYVVEITSQISSLIGGALVSMYSRCASLIDARYTFEKLPIKDDVVLWTTMITAYAHSEHAMPALNIFSQMLQKGIQPNSVTFASMLDACADEVALQDGKLLHASIVELGLNADLLVCNALVSMFSQCGSMHDALSVFSNMSKHNVVSWNALLSASSQHGHDCEVIHLFRQMQHEGVTPDEVTFLNILSICRHAGLVDEACYHICLMNQEYGVELTAEHYYCIVDLLGRVGRLQEAEELVQCMPYLPGTIVWSSFLSGCRVHGNLELGRHAADHVLELSLWNASALSMLEYGPIEYVKREETLDNGGWRMDPYACKLLDIKWPPKHAELIQH